MYNDDRRDIVQVKIFQLNTNRQLVATSLLNQRIKQEKTDIIMIQEPYQSKNRKFGIDSCRRIFAQHEQMKALTVTAVITSNIVGTALPESNSWLTCVRISTKTQPSSSFVLINAYLSPSSDIVKKLEHVEVVLLKYRSYAIIFSGDLNCRSKLFGDHTTTKRGRSLDQFVHRNSLTLVNNDARPTFESHCGASVIDLTFANPIAIKHSSVADWKLHTNYITTSDHHLISFSININKRDLETFPRLDEPLANIDYSSLTLSDLNLCFKEISHDFRQPVHEQVGTLTLNMQNAIINYTKTRKKTNQSSSLVEWWSAELSSIRSIVNRSRRVYQQSAGAKRFLNKQRYKLSLSSYRKAILQAKTRAWHQLCQSAEIWSTPFKYLLGKTKHRCELDYLQLNNATIYKPADILNEVSSKFFPQDDSKCDTELQSSIRLKVTTYLTDVQLEIIPPISSFEVNNALSSLKLKKCPGIDGLTVLTFKAYFNNNPSYFTSLVNRILVERSFPHCLKKSKVIFIKKPGKTGQHLSSFRPISLVSSFSKVVEHVILRRLNDFLDVNNLLGSRQFGFRKLRSAVDLQYQLLREIRSLRDSGKQVALLTIDISGAFDCAWHPQIINQLIDWGCPRYLVQIIASYLQDRKAMVQIQQQPFEVLLERGWPQGSVLGPNLWNVLVAHILSLDLDGVSSYAYADDFFLLLYANCEDDLLIALKSTLGMFTNKLRQIKLQVSIAKTKFMIVNNRRKQYAMDFEQQQLTSTDTIDILGVTFDRKLSFRQHLGDAIKKASKLNNMIRCLKSNHRGTDFMNLQTLYNCCIVPKVTYGAPVWASILQVKSWQKRIDSLNRIIACNLTRSFKTTSFAAATTILGKLPLKTAIQEAASKFYSFHNCGALGSNLTDYNVIDATHYGDLCRSPITTRFEAVRVPERLNQVNKRVYLRSIAHEGAIYVGIEAFDHRQLQSAKLLQFDNSYHLSEIDSILTLYAIENHTSPSNEGTEIFIEHPSLVIKVTKPDRKVSLVNSIRNKLCQNNVRLTYSDDKVSKRMSTGLCKSIMSNLDDAISVNQYSTKRREKLALRHKSIAAWNEEYTPSSETSVIRLFFPTIYNRPKSKIQTNFFISQFLSGYGDFRHYLSKIKQIDSPFCLCGSGSAETVFHILTECVTYDEIRRWFCSQIGKEKLTRGELRSVMMSSKLDLFYAFIYKVLNKRKKRITDPLYAYDSNIHKLVTELLRKDKDFWGT